MPSLVFRVFFSESKKEESAHHLPFQRKEMAMTIIESRSDKPEHSHVVALLRCL